MNRKDYYIVLNSLTLETHKCFVDLIHKDNIDSFLKSYAESIGYGKYEIENWNDFANTMLILFSDRVEFIDPMDELIEIDNKDLILIGMDNKDYMQYPIDKDELECDLLIEDVKHKREEFKRRNRFENNYESGIYNI